MSWMHRRGAEIAEITQRDKERFSVTLCVTSAISAPLRCIRLHNNPDIDNDNFKWLKSA